MRKEGGRHAREAKTGLRGAGSVRTKGDVAGLSRED